jgi:hypothetical protein
MERKVTVKIKFNKQIKKEKAFALLWKIFTPLWLANNIKKEIHQVKVTNNLLKPSTWANSLNTFIPDIGEKKRNKEKNLPIIRPHTRIYQEISFLQKGTRRKELTKISSNIFVNYN